MQITMEMALYVFVVQFASFFIKGLAGFGDPLLSNPMLSMMLENRTITPINLLMGTPINAYMVWKNRKSFSIRKAIPMALCILCGVIPGTLLLKHGSSWMLKAALGVLVIGLGIEMLTRDRAKPVKSNKFLMVFTSICSGITAGLYGINLFFVAYVERTSTDRNEFRGNICFIFFIENVFRLINYIILGIYTVPVLLLSCISAPGAALGVFVGQHIDKKLNEAFIRRFVIVIFIIGGVSILLKALIWKV